MPSTGHDSRMGKKVVVLPGRKRECPTVKRETSIFPGAYVGLYGGSCVLGNIDS